MTVYESKTSASVFKTRMESNKIITPIVQKSNEESMKKMFQKTFILPFDKLASIRKIGSFMSGWWRNANDDVYAG